MKKNYLKILLITLITFLINCSFVNNVNAASSTISVTSSKSTVIVNSSVTITVTLSSSDPLRAWEFSLNYDTSRFRLTSTGSLPHIVDYASNSSKKSATYTYTFKALKSGSATFSITGASVVGWDENKRTVNSSSRTVSVITQAQLEQSYSKNNYLKSLSIDGVDLTPTFDKDKLEYSVELKNDVTQIKVSATKEDSKASIAGTGDIKVVEGNNKIEVKVTAENGNVRTYVINALVKELSPVTVKIDNKDYTVVRKRENLIPPTGYIEETVLIQNEEIPAYKSNVTKFLLVALKDNDGNISMYIYDSNKETFKLYQELKFNQIILYYENPTVDIPKGYNKTNIKINDVTVQGYKLDSKSNYSLIYGMNIETGKEHLYMYDSDENTIQRYNGEEVNTLNKTINKYGVIIASLATTALVLIIITIMILIRTRKINKKVLNFDNTF